MIVAGLTGSIGMGKSTTAKMFADEGIPVHDADATVHALYAGEAVPLIETAFPGSTHNGAVDREALGAMVFGKPDELKKLESIIHPLVRAQEADFIATHRRAGAPLVILDIPLLFETGGDKRVDTIIVVTAPQEVQQQRVLSRPGMTRDKLAAILARQVPDGEKRERADFLVDTSQGLDAAREGVRDIIAALTTK